MEKPGSWKESHHLLALDCDPPRTAALAVTSLCWSANTSLWPSNTYPQWQQEGRTRGAQLSASCKMTPEMLELVMLLASASKEASQEQNVFHPSISNWTGPAFNSTLCQYFFERQTGIHLSNTGCRVNGLNSAASKFRLQAPLNTVASYWLYTTCTHEKLSHSEPIFITKIIRTGYSSQTHIERGRAWACPSLFEMV